MIYGTMLIVVIAVLLLFMRPSKHDNDRCQVCGKYENDRCQVCGKLDSDVPEEDYLGVNHEDGRHRCIVCDFNAMKP